MMTSKSLTPYGKDDRTRQLEFIPPSYIVHIMKAAIITSLGYRQCFG